MAALCSQFLPRWWVKVSHGPAAQLPLSRPPQHTHGHVSVSCRDMP